LTALPFFCAEIATLSLYVLIRNQQRATHGVHWLDGRWVLESREYLAAENF
jgi:hypothetical protein